MIDQNGRSIDYVRISITDRCNLRCIYCMPEEGVCGIEHAQILRFEEMIRVVRILTEVGVKHVRLTGGEPMVRRGCLELAARLHAIPGVESISMTSNGILLNDRVHQAKLAGISSLNISMDALDPAVYSCVTRGGDVSLVLRVLEQALEEGLNVKVNTVPVRGINEEDLPGIAALAREAPLCVRFIELMPVGYGMQAERIPYAAERVPYTAERTSYAAERVPYAAERVPHAAERTSYAVERIPYAEVAKILEEAFGAPAVDARIHGHGPARYVTYPHFKGSVGFISAISHEFCDSCNRVRLTADGQLKLCLNHTKGLDLRAMLRRGADDGEILDAVRSAIAEKPRRHGFYETIGDHETRTMNAIGG